MLREFSAYRIQVIHEENGLTGVVPELGLKVKGKDGNEVLENIHKKYLDLATLLSETDSIDFAEPIEYHRNADMRVNGKFGGDLQSSAKAGILLLVLFTGIVSGYLLGSRDLPGARNKVLHGFFELFMLPMALTQPNPAAKALHDALENTPEAIREENLKHIAGIVRHLQPYFEAIRPLTSGKEPSIEDNAK